MSVGCWSHLYKVKNHYNIIAVYCSLGSYKYRAYGKTSILVGDYHHDLMMHRDYLGNHIPVLVALHKYEYYHSTPVWCSRYSRFQTFETIQVS